MADEPNKPDAGDTLKIRGSVDSETAKIQRDKLTLKKLDPNAAAASAQESEKTGSGDTRLSDPTRRRDTNTASLRRIRPKTSLGDTNAGEERKEDTETIHLKVIKEKKNINQLKNLLSASQTIRLRPSTGASAPAAPPSTISEEPIAAPLSPSGGDDQKRTLKIKAPSAAEAKTESIGRAPIRLTAAPGADAPSKLSETGELNASMQAPSSKSTLKIKAPPASGSTPTATPADAAEKKSRSTLKIKAPTASGTGPGAPTVKQPAAAAASDRTTKQEAPKASKTLKLKSTPRPDDQTAPGMPEPAAETAQAAPQAQTMVGSSNAQSAQPQGGEPNIIDTLAALGAVAVGVAAAVVFGVMPFLNLYGG